VADISDFGSRTDTRALNSLHQDRVLLHIHGQVRQRQLVQLLRRQDLIYFHNLVLKTFLSDRLWPFLKYLAGIVQQVLYMTPTYQESTMLTVRPLELIRIVPRDWTSHMPLRRLYSVGSLPLVDEKFFLFKFYSLDFGLILFLRQSIRTYEQL